MPKEKLPLGVGRVPAWWMELTPHYVLDLEEDSQRREQELQEALYYAQMAAADDARISGEWKSNWGGRAANGGSGGNGGGLFGGRNFQPRSDGWDPKEWGVAADDPDYKAYLTGAKLPQSYIDAMKEFAGQAGIEYDASQLNHTGKYGSSASRPAFTPAWAKKKLRSTGQGEAIRQGLYNDSPNKHIKRKVAAESAALGQEPSASTLPSSPALAAPEPVPVEPEEPVEAEPEPIEAEPEPVEETPTDTVSPTSLEATPAPAPASSKAEFAFNPLPAPVPVAPRVTNTQPENNTTPVETPKYNFSDYYYNAVGPVKLVMPEPKVEPKPEQAPTPPRKLAAPEQAPPVDEEESEPAAEEEVEEVEYEEVIEYVDDYDGEEYEEVVEEYVEEEEPSGTAAPQAADLSDLQALLAQKQAELAKLQGM